MWGSPLTGTGRHEPARHTGKKFRIVCNTTDFSENPDGSITGPQNCANDADVLPITAEVNGTLTVFAPETAPTLFVSTEESGAVNASYTTEDGVVRYMGVAPGAGDFDGETSTLSDGDPSAARRSPGSPTGRPNRATHRCRPPRSGASAPS